MKNLGKRMSQLEKVRAAANLKNMTDEELDTHLKTFDTVTDDFMDALIAQINRKGSAFPIIEADPECPPRKGPFSY